MSSAKIKVTGNMKFDIKIRDYAELRKDYTDYRLRFGLGPKDRLLLAASTHAGEEAAVLKIYNELLAGHPKLRLLIAPRHPERAQAVEKTAAKFNLVPSRISFFSSQADAAGRQEKPQDRKTVFILDTVGQLMYFYAISDIVFVGGSLVKKGGHNILEPASLGKPILFGAHMFNFRDIANLFLSAQAALSVANPLELKEKIEYLLGDENRLNDLGRLSKEIILANQGATLKNQQVLREVLNNARDIL